MVDGEPLEDTEHRAGEVPEDSGAIGDPHKAIRGRKGGQGAPSCEAGRGWSRGHAVRERAIGKVKHRPHESPLPSPRLPSSPPTSSPRLQTVRHEDT